MYVNVRLQEDNTVIQVRVAHVHKIPGVELQIDYPDPPRGLRQLQRQKSMKPGRSPWDEEESRSSQCQESSYSNNLYPQGHLRSQVNRNGFAPNARVEDYVQPVQHQTTNEQRIAQPRRGVPQTVAPSAHREQSAAGHEDEDDLKSNQDETRGMETGAFYQGIGKNELHTSPLLREHISGIDSAAASRRAQQAIHEKRFEERNRQNESELPNRRSSEEVEQERIAEREKRMREEEKKRAELLQQEQMRNEEEQKKNEDAEVKEVHKGWVKKCGEGVGSWLGLTWNDRYFILSSDGKLRYYTNPQKAKEGIAKGMIQLTAGDDVCKEDAWKWSIVTKERTWYFKCNENTDTRQWVRVIGAQLPAHQAAPGSGVRRAKVSSTSLRHPDQPRKSLDSSTCTDAKLANHHQQVYHGETPNRDVSHQPRLSPHGGREQADRPMTNQPAHSEPTYGVPQTADHHMTHQYANSQPTQGVPPTANRRVIQKEPISQGVLMLGSSREETSLGQPNGFHPAQCAGYFDGITNNHQRTTASSSPTVANTRIGYQYNNYQS